MTFLMDHTENPDEIVFQRTTMKNYLLAILLCCCSSTLLAQAVPNPSFELWNDDTTFVPRTWFNSNLFARMVFGQPNVTRSTDAHGGLYAIRMETFANATDTMFGYIANVPGDPNAGIGGVPYTQQPNTLLGWAKYDIMPGDSALMIVSFKAGGLVISTDYFWFTGTASNYTLFQMPLSLSAMPDTVIIAAGSSFADGQGLANGSWLMLDDLSFNTSNAIESGDFESWLTLPRSEPIGWTSPDMYGDTAEVASRTTDAITGQYAVRIETRAIFGGQDTLGYLTSGQFNGGNQAGGQPYSLMTDTLCGYYKYAGMGLDSAIVGAVFFQGGNLVNVAALYLESKSVYTYFEIPFQLGAAPDTVRIDIWSSNPNSHAMAGSVLIIDSLRFKSDPLVGLPQAGPRVEWLLFPNPSQGQVWLEAALPSADDYQLELLNMAGQRVFLQSLPMAAGLNRIGIDLGSLSAGVYLARLRGDSYLGTMRVVVGN